MARGRINSKKGEILGCAGGSESGSRGLCAGLEMVQKRFGIGSEMVRKWLGPAVRKWFRNRLESVRKWFGNGWVRQFGHGSEMWPLGGVTGENGGAKCETFPNHFQTDSEPFLNRLWRPVGKEKSNLGTATSGT